MVKLYASILALALTTSLGCLALAVPLMDVSLEAREPNWFNLVKDAAMFAVPGGAEVKGAEEAVKLARGGYKAYNAYEHMHDVHKALNHHRRDLEELSRRDLDDEEFFGREYIDFLAERDFFDDLD